MNERELIAFELGYDHAMFARPAPDDAPLQFADGYRTGKRQYPHPQRSNRFIRKWLQIRMNALRRDKRVDERITPDYIERIDVERCPVTLEPLMHSTGTGADWSIDRCNNQRGYIPGNLVVMSTRANKAKSDLTFIEIVENSKRAESTDGLRPADWHRMAAVVAPAECLTSGEPPAQYLLGEAYVPGQPWGLPAHVQAALLSGFLNPSHAKRYDTGINTVYALSRCSKASRRAFDRMLKDMARRVVHQGRDWNYWALKRPLRLFVEFWVTLTPAARTAITDQVGFNVGLAAPEGQPLETRSPQ